MSIEIWDKSVHPDVLFIGHTGCLVDLGSGAFHDDCFSEYFGTANGLVVSGLSATLYRDIVGDLDTAIDIV